MRAVILVGGRGLRLAPYTDVLPKPLMPLDGTPILEVVLRQLAARGFRRVTLCTGHLHELVRSFAGDGERFGLRVDYSREEGRLGTAAPLRMVPDLSDHFLCMNGDVLTDLDTRRLVDEHLRRGAEMTIAAHAAEVGVDLGVLEVDGRGTLVGYTEKPMLSYLVSMGVYVLSREVLRHIPIGRPFDMPELVSRLLDQGRPVAVHHSSDYWLDIGRHGDYDRARAEFARWRSRLLPAEEMNGSGRRRRTP